MAASTIHRLFAERAARAPDAVAVRHGAASINYGELAARAHGVAAELRAHGVTHGTPVAVSLERSIEQVAALLGVLEAGAVYVPIDPAHPPARRALVLEDTGAPVVIGHTPADAAGTATRVLVSDPRTRADAALADADDPDPLAAIIYTSGSTGRPKGVCLTHHAWARVALAPDYFDVAPSDVVGQTANVAFDASLMETLAALLGCATLEVFDTDTVLSPHALARAITARGVTVMFLATGLFNQLAGLDPAAFRGLRALHLGGDVPDARRVRAVLEQSGPLVVTNGYGPTEATACATAHTLATASDVTSPLPIGRPIAGAEVLLLDARGEPAERGEIHLGGERIAAGYWRRPELTAARFVPHPTRAGERVYKTGDLAERLPSGELVFVGRADDQVKIRGFRVEPQEVEAVLRTHPGAREAAVVARVDASGGKTLVAYVVPAVEAPLTFLAERLPAFMVPSAVVALDALPLTPTGKLDRDALPEPERAEATHAPSADATPAEVAIAALFAEVLGVDRVEPEDDFFGLGGHSLLATQLLARIHQQLERELPASALFTRRTPRALAPALADAPKVAPEDTRITRGAPSELCPLTFAQGRAFFMEALDPANIAYNSAAVIRLRGAIQVPALVASLEALVARHESLRTTVEAGPDGPVGRVHPPWSLTLPIVDRPGLDDRARGEEARAIAREDARRPFVPGRLPLLRWTLVRFADDDHAIAHVEHHIVHDGWSFQVLLRELFTSYVARLQGRPDPVPAPPIQLSDFARWQRALVASPAGRAQLEHHRARLGGAPNLDLPGDHPRPPRQTFRGRAPRIHLDAALLERIDAVARARDTTRFVVMLAALELLITRHTGRTDVVLGTGIASRRAREAESVLGMLVNNLVLRTDLSGDPVVADVIDRVRATVLEAYDHQDVPFEQVVEAVRPPRDASRTPLIQAMFSFHDTPAPRLDVPGVSISLDLPVENGTSKLDLNVVGVPDAARLDASGGMTMVFEHNADLFEPATIARLMRNYQVVLERLPDALTVRASALDVLAPEERERVVVSWNDTARPYPRDVPVHALFAAQAARTPDAIALVSGDREERYAALAARAHRVARRLHGVGVRPGDRVAFAAGRTVETVAAIIGILEVGAAYVPLDPTYPAERLARMLDVTQPRALCSVGPPPPALRRDHLALIDLARDEDGPPFDPAPVDPTAAAYVMFTSGSTGEPRGVEVPHRAIVRLVYGIEGIELSARETLLHLSPISFDASTFELWGALLHGGRCVLFPEDTPSPRALGELVRGHDVTTLWLTASLFNAVVDDEPSALASVRQLIAGGEVLSVPHVRRALEQLPALRLMNGYGPTETTTFACCHPIVRPLGEVESIPIGRPIGNTRVYVLDGARQVAPIGVPGELFIGGDGLARGYVSRPELTAERFVRVAALEDGPLYRTGDRVRWRDDGVLEILGRDDHQVKVRGFRIELGEVEAALLACPGVRSAAVVLQRDARGDKRLAAFAVAADTTEARLLGALRDALPAYMIPASVALVDALPLTPVGKVDRAALAAQVGAPEPTAHRHDRPIDPSEVIMAEIWSRLLGLENIGRHDNFFALGGHSLLAARLVDEMERALGVRLPLTAVLEEATIASMGRHLRERGRGAPIVVPLRAEGRRPPLFYFHGDFNGGGYYAVRVARRLDPDQPCYLVHPFGTYDDHVPPTLSEIADRYVAAIREARPRGPYRLAGYCTSGIIAHEVARRLGDVERLVVLDTVPRNPELAPVYDLVGRLGERAVERLHARVRVPLLGRAWLVKRKSQASQLGLRKLIEMVRRDARRIDVAVPAEGSADRAYELIAIYRRLVAAHVPRRFDGPLTVVWSRDDPTYASRTPDGGWRSLARSVEARTIGGDHLTCVTRHWEELAAELARALG